MHFQTVQIQDEPNPQDISLSQDNQTVDLQPIPCREFCVSIEATKSQQLQIKGSRLCCIVYMNYSPDEELYNEKQPVSSFYHKQSYYVDNERIVIHFEITNK